MVDWVGVVLFEIVELFVEYEVFPKENKTTTFIIILIVKMCS
jgi:hypothetical protein